MDASRHPRVRHRVQLHRLSPLRRALGVWLGYEGENIVVAGQSKAYVCGDQTIEFHFCPDCGGVSFWRSIEAGSDGRRRMAVNLRQTEPEWVAHIPIDHFDGLDSFEDLPRDGRCVADYWF